MRHSIIEKCGSALGIVLLALVAILLCVSFRGVVLRMDCTEEKSHTLSSATRKALSNLQKTVTIHYYYSKDLAQVPVAYKNYARRVEELLREYEIASKGKLKVVKRNPKPDTDAEDAAALDGVMGQSGAMLGVDQQIYLGLAVLCGSQKSSLPFLNPAKENLLEYELTRAVLAVASPTKHKVGVMSPLQLFGGIQNPSLAMQGQGAGMAPAWIVISELKKDYEVVQLPMDVAEIPQEIDIVLAVHPRGIADATEYALDQFVLRGGHLIAFLDPICLVDLQTQQQRTQRSYVLPDATSNLPHLLKAWGMEFSTDEVVLDRTCATMIHRSRQGEAEKMPNVLTLTAEQMDTKDVLCSQLSELLLLNAGAFGGNPVAGLEQTVLLKSSGDSAMAEKYVTQRSGEDMLREFQPDGKNRAFAVRLRGNFPTAFPEKEGGLKTASKEGVVVLLGDADMLYDPFCVQRSEVFGQSFYQTLNSNLAFVQNLVESLCGDSSLFEIRTRGLKPRPFTRVLEMERCAEEAYRDEIKRFEGEVEAVQQELFALQRSKGGQDKELLSAEQRNAIQRIREREGEARKNLKEVRKRQRRDVEQLENRLMLLNIALMPALVILCGIGVAFLRRKRG